MAKPKRWYLKKIDDSTYYAETGEGERTYVRNEHCIRCAYAKVVAERGGDCSLRGLNDGGYCYGFLAGLVNATRREGVNGS